MPPDWSSQSASVLVEPYSVHSCHFTKTNNVTLVCDDD